MAETVKVQHNGAEIEVQLPAGYIAESVVKEQYMPKSAFQTELDRRVSGITKDLAKPEDLLKNEEFRTRALAEWKVGGSDAGRIEAARKEWDEKELAPVRSLNTELMASRIGGDVLAAAAAVGVKAAMMKPVVPGGEPLIVTMFRDALGYDPKTKGVYVKSADGFAYSSNPAQHGPYKTALEALSEWAATPAAADFLDPKVRTGLGFTGTGTPSGGAVTLEEFEKMNSTQRTEVFHKNHDLWVQLMAQLREKGEAKLLATNY